MSCEAGAVSAPAAKPRTAAASPESLEITPIPALASPSSAAPHTEATSPLTSVLNNAESSRVPLHPTATTPATAPSGDNQLPAATRAPLSGHLSGNDATNLSQAKSPAPESGTLLPPGRPAGAAEPALVSGERHPAGAPGASSVEPSVLDRVSNRPAVGQPGEFQLAPARPAEFQLPPSKPLAHPSGEGSELQLPPAKPLAELPLAPAKPLTRVSGAGEGGEFQLPPARPQEFQLAAARPAAPATNDSHPAVTRTGGSVAQGAPGDIPAPGARPAAGPFDGNSGLTHPTSIAPETVLSNGPASGRGHVGATNGNGRDSMDRCLPSDNPNPPAQVTRPAGSAVPSAGELPATGTHPAPQADGKPGVLNTSIAPDGTNRHGSASATNGNGRDSMDRCLPSDNPNPVGTISPTGAFPGMVSPAKPAAPKPAESGQGQPPAPLGVIQDDFSARWVPGTYRHAPANPIDNIILAAKPGSPTDVLPGPTPPPQTHRIIPAERSDVQGDRGERMDSLLRQLAGGPTVPGAPTPGRPGERGSGTTIVGGGPTDSGSPTNKPMVSGEFALPSVTRNPVPSVADSGVNVSGSGPKPGNQLSGDSCPAIFNISTGQLVQTPAVSRTESQIEMARRLVQPEGVPSPGQLPRILVSESTQTLTTLLTTTKPVESFQLPPASRPVQAEQQVQSELRRINNEILPALVRNERPTQQNDCGEVCPVQPIRREEIKPQVERATEFMARLQDMLNSRESREREAVSRVETNLIKVRPVDLAQWTAPRETERVADRVYERASSETGLRVQLETLPFSNSSLRPALELARSSTAIANEPSRLSDVIGRTAVEPQQVRIPADKASDVRMAAIPGSDAGRSSQLAATNFPTDLVGNLPPGGITAEGRAIPGITADGRIIPGVTADGRIILADGRIVAPEVRPAHEGRHIQTTLADGRSVLTDGRIMMPDGKIVAPEGKAVHANAVPGVAVDVKANSAEVADKGGKNIVVDPVLGPVRIIVTPSGETIMVPIEQQPLAATDKSSDRKDTIEKGDRKTDKEKEDEEKEKELALLLGKRKERKPEPKDEVKQDDKTNKQQLLQQRRKYLVRTGDTVESVASAQLGDQRYSVLICIINRAVIRFDWEGAKSTAKLRVGQIIWLPSPSEMQVHRAMFFKNGEATAKTGTGAMEPGEETVGLEEMKLPELQLNDPDSDTVAISKVQTALDAINLAPAINKPLPPVAKPPAMSALPAKIEGRPSVRVSSQDNCKTESQNDLALADRNWRVLLDRVAGAVAEVRDAKSSAAHESMQQQMLIEKMATVIKDCTPTPSNTVSFLPGALRNTKDDQGAPTSVLMTVQRANCTCRVVTVENAETKSFSTRLQISNNQTEWTTVASYECSEKRAVRYLNKGNGTVDTFTLRLPSTVIRSMASQDLIRNWESYVSTYGR